MIHSRKFHFLNFIIATIGALLTIYMVNRHIVLFSGGESESFCNINSRLSCDAIEFSPYSEIFKIPTAAFGLAFYLFVGLMATVGLSNPYKRREATLLIWLASIPASLAGVLLTLVSSVMIHAVCVYCLTSHFLSILLLLTTSIGFVKSNEGPTSMLIKGLESREGKGKTQGIEMKTLFSLAATGLVISLLGIFVSRSMNLPEGPDHDPSRFIARFENLPEFKFSSAGSPSTGNPKAPMTIVEFSDFQCPACRFAFRSLKPTVRRFPDKVRLIYRHFPLDMSCNDQLTTRMHPYACLAARSSICVRAQKGDEGFFKFHDEVFNNQELLSEKFLMTLAKNQGVNMEAFQACLSSPETLHQLSEDIRTAVELGIQATPTLFVNGKKLEGGLSREEFETLIEHLSK